MEASALAGASSLGATAILPLKPSLSASDVHVLVVDDERLSRTVVANVLRKCGYRVTTADSGAEAVELLRSQPPCAYNLVLTDVCMPEVDGIQLLHYVKREHALRCVPVVMMSASDTGETVLECVRGGAEEFLVKPVTRKEAQHMWQHVVRKQMAAPPQTPVPQAEAEAAEAAEAPPPPPPSGRRSASASGSTASVEQPPAAVAPAQAQPLARAQAQAQAQAPSAAAGSVDYASTSHALRLMREAREAELQDVARQLHALDEDAAAVAAALRAHDCGDAEPAGKRCRRSWSGGAGAGAESGGTGVAGRWELPAPAHIAAALEPLYFQRRAEYGGQRHLETFSRDLDLLARAPRLALQASVRGGDLCSAQEMVCCADFDADDRHFATVSVSRSLKVFDFEGVLAAPAALHFPAWQATTRSKLSSVAWSAYVRSHLITSDYDGLIQLWDTAAGPGAEAAQFDEHARRVWSVDFCRTDPMRFLSGSDDGSIRLWSVNQEASVCRLQAPANVCSVRFSPGDAHTVAAGCANRCAYVYDLRRAAQPAAVVVGPSRRAVSYVRFMGPRRLAAASTDSAVRLWDLDEALAVGGKDGGGGGLKPLCTYASHTNERNFVGLSVSEDGYLACGSEDDSVHAYYHTLPFSVAQHSFGEGGPGGGGGGGAEPAAPAPARAAPRGSPFVSTVAWARGGRHCLAANSQGLLRVLKLE